MTHSKFANPFRPGAGHMPPYLAGRKRETEDFTRLLSQSLILENLVLTGLRGVGKTVLLDTFKPLAIKERWLWVGTDLSEAVSLSEDRMAQRLMIDLAVVTSSLVVQSETVPGLGFDRKSKVDRWLDFELMARLFDQTHGLASDKLKAVLEFVWECLKQTRMAGVIFAYDEAQNLSDHAKKEQYPLSLLLDVFQSLQKKGIPFMLVLAGLPTLFPKLVEARTFAERMFRVMFLDRLNEKDSREAIEKPIADSKCPAKFSSDGVQSIIIDSGGYPYFIQFICREAFDVYLQKLDCNDRHGVNLHEITRKLDTDFFAGRWARATDRQRDLLTAIAKLDTSDNEFTVQEVAEKSKELTSPFSASHVNQMLVKLSESGLVYKNRHGRYSFAVPLLGRFILRQLGTL